VASDLESKPSELPDLDAGAPFRSTIREVRAAGPGPEAERLREAYLDLLKLSLCDLAGAGTTSVIWNSVDPVHTRELEGEDVKRRVVGQDWPLHGLSMIGLERLDDLQAVVESVVADEIPGDLIEAGSWRGGATILMRATLDSLGADDRTVYACDSFAGFPEPDEEYPEDPKLQPLTEIGFLSADLDDVRAHFARFGLERGIEFVKGFFEDTLPQLPERQYSVVRLDGDTYEAIWLGLESLYPRLSPGGYLVVDDYSFIDACRRAVDDYRREHGIVEPIERIDWNGIRWRREPEHSTGPAPEPPAAQEASDADGSTTLARPTERIPSQNELALERELAEARERLAAADRELTRLRGSPLAGPAAWVRSRTRGR
jgi:O-methyltransferase